MSNKTVDNYTLGRCLDLFQPASASCDIEEEFSFGFEILHHILLSNLKKALEAFQNNKTAILYKACKEKGLNAKKEIEDQFKKLENFYNDISKSDNRKLLLISNEENEKLKIDIEMLNNISDSSEPVSSIVNSVVSVFDSI